jgi:hypothetical protein
VSGLRRHRKEELNPTFYRGLTARPVVLAKTYEPGAVMFSRPEVPFPGPTFPPDGSCEGHEFYRLRKNQIRMLTLVPRLSFRQ